MLEVRGTLAHVQDLALGAETVTLLKWEQKQRVWLQVQVGLVLK